MHRLIANCLVVSCLGATLAAQQLFTELRRAHLPAPVPDARTLAVIDIDGDGGRDLLLGGWGTPSTLWRNDGTGTFTDLGSPGSLNRVETINALAVGDLNGDGLDDVVQATIGHGLVMLFNFAGQLYDAPSGHLPALPVHVGAVALIDCDGDGDRDIVYCETGTAFAYPQIIVNDGTGHFASGGPWVSSSSSGTSSFLVFDRDGDGDEDLLVLSYGSPAELLVNDAGSFAPVALPANLPPMAAAAAGDVDGDGDIDLLLGSAYLSPLLRQDRLLRNNGAGGYVDDTATAMPVVVEYTSAMHLSDIDGDGDLDAVVSFSQVGLFGNRLGHQLLRNDGTGVFADDSLALPINDLAAGRSLMCDVDGDGDDDYVFAGNGGQQLYRNQAGTFVDVAGPALPYRGGTTEGVAAGDLDGDGLPELVAAGWNFSILSGRTSLFWSDGAGRVAEVASNPIWPNGIYSSAALGDIDGDGDLDVVFGLDQPGQNRIYRNDGNRVLTDVTATALPAQVDYTRVVRFLDYDQDGDLDLLFGNSDASRLLQNDGAGTFTDVSASTIPGGVARDLAIGDVDGDGDDDVVIANVAGPNALWLGGGGVLQLAPGRLPALVQATEAVALVDVDGDGDLDLIVGNRPESGLDPRSWLHLNDGAGNFTATTIPLLSADVRAIAVGDIDADGDVDFVLGGHGIAPRLFENFGGALFVQRADALPGDVRQTNRMVLADVDGDGDLDLFEGDGNGDRLLSNLHRQLHARHQLVPGAVTEFEVNALGGAPGAVPFAALFVGSRAAPLPTPFGPVRIDVATAVPVAVLPLPPAQPSATWALAVPANPALAGFELAAQALIAHDLAPVAWRLSGLVAETVVH